MTRPETILDLMQILTGLAAAGLSGYAEYKHRADEFMFTRQYKALFSYGILNAIGGLSLIAAYSQTHGTSPHFGSVTIAYFTDCIANLSLQLSSVLFLRKGVIDRIEEEKRLRESDGEDDNNCSHPERDSAHKVSRSSQDPSTSSSSPFRFVGSPLRNVAQPPDSPPLGEDNDQGDNSNNNEDNEARRLKKANTLINFSNHSSVGLILISGILALFGFMNLMNEDGHIRLNGPNCVKAASVLQLVAILPNTIQAVVCLRNRKTLYSALSASYIYATLGSTPFMLIRSVFAIGTAFALRGNALDKHKFSLINGDWHTRAAMVQSMELPIVIMYCGAMTYLTRKGVNRRNSCDCRDDEDDILNRPLLA